MAPQERVGPVVGERCDLGVVTVRADAVEGVVGLRIGMENSATLERPAHDRLRLARDVAVLSGM